MRTNKIIFLLSIIIMILCLMSCGGTKNTYQSGKEKEVTSQGVKNPDKTQVIKTTAKIPDGPFIEYYESGKLKEISNYKNGKLEGKSMWYYESGILKGERNYKNGKLEGIIKWYYDTGSLATEFNYKNGRLEGLTILYWENGNVKAEHNYVNGKRDGINKQYYNSGELRFIYFFDNGKRISKKTYSKTGRLLSEQDY